MNLACSRLRGGGKERAKASKEPAAPSKDEVVQALLGAAGENLKMGIVGLPNIGKSSLFNLMANTQVPAENYPFCTIEPNVARMKVSDSRFNWLCGVYKPRSRVGAMLQVTDIAGLVRGAAEGQGLGNKFLSHIYAVDGIFHVVRAFKEPSVEHVEGSVDPTRDLQIISEELRKKDIEVMEGRVKDLEKRVLRVHQKELLFDLQTAKYIQAGLHNGTDTRFLPLSIKQAELVRTWSLLTAKPVVFLVNVQDSDFKSGRNKWIREIKCWVSKNAPGAKTIPFSVGHEAQLQSASLDTENNQDDVSNGTRPISMIPKIIKEGYKSLGLIHFFTTGPLTTLFICKMRQNSSQGQTK